MDFFSPFANSRDKSFSMTTSVSGEERSTKSCMDVNFLCKTDATDESDNFCTRCLESFGSAKELQRHVSSKHRTISPPESPRSVGHACPICARTFSHRHNMRRHIDMVHQNKRPHVCEYCDKAFMTRSCVRRHIARKHT